MDVGTCSRVSSYISHKLRNEIQTSCAQRDRVAKNQELILRRSVYKKDAVNNEIKELYKLFYGIFKYLDKQKYEYSVRISPSAGEIKASQRSEQLFLVWI